MEINFTVEELPNGVFSNLPPNMVRIILNGDDLLRIYSKPNTSLQMIKDNCVVYVSYSTQADIEELKLKGKI
jgi:hypothetical protein